MTADTDSLQIPRMDWERQIIDVLSDRLEIPNGDAQVFVEAHLFEVAQAWSKGSSPASAAYINLPGTEQSDVRARERVACGQ